MSTAPENPVKSDLFKDVKYYMSGTIEPEIQKLLENGGASSAKIMFGNVTHLLCGPDFDDKDTAEATEIFDIPSVTGEWVKASIKLGHLACPKTYHPLPSGLFTSCVVAVAQLNANDRKKLYALVTFHGGRVERNFTAQTTHLVCGIGAGHIYTKAMEMKSNKFHIITPDWFYECLKAQDICDPKPYHPRLLKPGFSNHANDSRSLSNILGLDDLKSDLKKTDTAKPISQMTTKHIETTSSSSMSNTVTSVTMKVNSSISAITTASATGTTMPMKSITTENKPKVEKLQPKPMDMPQQPVQKSTANQMPANLNKPTEPNVKEKLEPQQIQTMTQVSKPITPSISTPTSTPIPVQTRIPTPTTPVQTQFLQKQLEQPLKMDNQNITMQQITQHQHQHQTQQPNQPQIQQFQVQQAHKPPQNQQQQAQTQLQHQHQQQQQQQMMQNQQMMNQVKIEQTSNQMMAQKVTMNASAIQGQQSMHTHVPNISNQPTNISIQSQNIGAQPPNLPGHPQNIGMPQNQIQIAPIQQQQQIQSNQMQQIGVDPSGQSGQMQFINAPPPGAPTNFNPMQQNQQMKVVQQQQINVQQQQHQQMQQPTQQFIVQSPGPNKTILNQNVVFINQSGQQQIITSNQQQGNNVALIQQQQRNITSQQPMQIQGQQILIHSSVQQPNPNQNQLLQSPQQQTQFIVQSSPGQGGQMINQSPRMQKVPGAAPGTWFMQQQQPPQQQPPQQLQQQPQQMAQQQGMVPGTDINQSVSPQQQMQSMQQKLIQQSPGGSNQQVAYSNMQNVEHQEVMSQQHNQTIMITGNQSQQQQPPQTPPIQQAQGIMQGQPQMQKMHVQNQQIVLAPNQSPQHGGMQMQTLSPQQPKPQPPQSPQVNALPGQPQFIRATRPQWAGNQQGLQRQLIQLDAQTHAHLQTLDPIQRAEYLSKLHKRNLLFRQQQQGFIQQGNAGQPRPPNHIITRPQMPGAPMQWIQQQQQQQQQQQPQQQPPPQQRPLLVRSAAPGLSPISQQTIVSPGGNIAQQQSPVPQSPFQDPNAPPQFQRIQIQQGPGQKPMPQANMVVPVQKPFPENADQQPPPNQIAGIVQQSPTGDSAANQAQMNKTKTALANMLSNRLSNSGANGAPMPMQTTDGQNLVEPSAAGTLRMMTAQHNSPGPQAQQQFQVDPNATQQFQRIQIQPGAGQKPIPQGNMIVTAQKPFTENVDQQPAPNQVTQVTGMLPQTPPTDATAAAAAAAAAVTPPQMQMIKVKTPLIQSPSGMKSPPFSPNRPLPRPQFYGHNPNLKLPPNLFLLGCIFYIVEYDESHVNEMPEWKKLIQHHGGEVETVYCPRVTHVLCRTQRHGVVMQAIRDSKRCVTAYWLNDTILRKQVQPPSEALHLPMPNTFGTQRPATKHIICVSGFEGDERIRVKQMVEESGALYTPYFSRHNSVLICKKLDGNKYKRAKDWNIPVVNCVWLSDILQGNLSHMSQYDQQKYQQFNVNGPLRIDYSLVAHLMNAWKSPINLTQDSYERVKRLLAEPAANEPKPKKIRKYEPLEVLPNEIVCNEKPEQVPHILFSTVDNFDGLKNAVTSLGGEVVTEPETATHLVLTQLVRTYKLLYALCFVNHIVSSKWIVDSAKAGKFLRPDEYALNDESFRKLFNCDIQEVIKSTTRKTLFAGKTFFVTPSVRPKPKDIVKLIEFCGGKVELKRRNAAQILQANGQQPDSYIILTCTQDLHLVHDLMKVGKSNRCICSTELIMAAIMHQKIDIEAHIITYDRPRI